MTLTGCSFWSRHRHITRVPTSRGRCADHAADAVEGLGLLSMPPPFDAAPAPLHAASPAAAAEPFSGAVDASIEPILVVGTGADRASGCWAVWAFRSEVIFLRTILVEPTCKSRRIRMCGL
jgi:hypothetical protein